MSAGKKTIDGDEGPNSEHTAAAQVKRTHRRWTGHSEWMHKLPTRKQSSTFRQGSASVPNEAWQSQYPFARHLGP